MTLLLLFAFLKRSPHNLFFYTVVIITYCHVVNPPVNKLFFFMYFSYIFTVIFHRVAVTLCCQVLNHASNIQNVTAMLFLSLYIFPRTSKHGRSYRRDSTGCGRKDKKMTDNTKRNTRSDENTPKMDVS